MKAIKFLCMLTLLFLYSRAYADHAAGGYFKYTCLENNQYRVDYYFLRNCEGLAAPNTMTYFLTNTCTTTTCWPTDGISASKINTENVNYGCGDGCESNSEGPKLQLIQYSAIITLPYECAEWRVSVSIPLRSEVDYCEPTYDGYYYNYCTINNLNGNCTSSVDIIGAPYAVGCINTTGISLYEVINSNGNTLLYDFVYPQEGTCQEHSNMNYQGNTSPNRPCPASADFTLTDGSFSFTPTNLSGTSYFAVRIREYNAANILLGTTIIDGMVFVSNECLAGNSITFSDWFYDNDNEYHVSATGEFCAEMHMTPTDNDDFVTNVVVEGVPSYLTTTIEYNQDGTSNVRICGEFPPEVLCQQLSLNIQIHANSSSESCLNYVTGSHFTGYYYLIKERGDYCPENLYFTNRNPTSGNIMPVTARAEERIWIGDNMPAPYDPFTDGVEGNVFVPNNGHYTAGIEVILPSCDNGTACVTLMGNVTLEIDPGSCSADCYREPLTVHVKEVFKCSQEKLEVLATGEGPFTYVLIILGDTITSEIGNFQIHDIISEQDNGQVPYTINVYDAIGDSGTFSGFILGTKRFYEPIIHNKHYFTYPSGSPWGESGYYYDANLWIWSSTPAYWTDSVNTSPPWYGATHMWLTIWDRWGVPINDINHDLELQPDGSGGEDWSLNQGEFWWNGKDYNGIWADCHEDELSEMFAYVLKARNCYNDESIDFFVQDIDEEASVWIISCTDDDPWNPVETKSTNGGDDNNDYFESQKFTGHTRMGDFPIVEEQSISIAPNPTNNYFELIGKSEKIKNLRILDQSGKVVLKKDKVSNDEKIDVSSLGSGIYIIHCETDTGSLLFKLTIL